MTKSPISGNDGKFLFQHDVIGRFPAQYYLDESIGYIWAENPTWLDAAYDDAIALSDTGILARNLKNIELVANVLRHNKMEGVKGVDIGGGYGVFVRGIRDVGLNFYWSDKYAENLMARGLEAQDDTFDVAVAFEVLEHLPNPLQFLRDSRKEHGWGTLIFTATCFDPGNLPGTDWWYWSFETGQHISFFSLNCLNHIAHELGLRLVHLKGDMYAFTDRNKFTRPGKLTARMLQRRFRKASLLQTDYEEMKRRLKNTSAPS